MLWYIKNFLNKRRIFFNLDVQDSNVWFFFDSDQSSQKGKDGDLPYLHLYRVGPSQRLPMDHTALFKSAESETLNEAG